MDENDIHTLGEHNGTDPYNCLTWVCILHVL